jgi:hypothetical protein
MDAGDMEAEDGSSIADSSLTIPLFTSLTYDTGRYSRAGRVENTVPRRHGYVGGRPQLGMRAGVGAKPNGNFSTYLNCYVRVFASPCRPYTCVGVVG